MSCTYIRGAVTVEGSTPVEGIADVTVVLSATDGIRKAAVASVVTDATGRFAIDVDAGVVGPTALPLYTLTAWKDRVELTLETVPLWRRDTEPGDVILCVIPSESCPAPEEDEPDFEPGSTYALTGRVTHEDGTPAAGVAVRLWAVDIFAPPEDPDATATTTAGGWYGMAAPLPTDFQVKAFAPSGDERLLATADARFDVTFPTRQDLRTCDSAYRQPTEWQRINADLSPLVPLGNLGDVDTRSIAALCGKTGWDMGRILRWVRATTLADTWTPTTLLATAQPLYGLFRQGFPMSADALLARRGLGVSRALATAHRKNIISASALAAEATILALFETQAKAQLSGTRGDSLASLLTVGTGGLTTDQVSEFCDVYLSFSGTTEAFWTLIGEQSHFDAAAVLEAQRRITLGTLALGWAPCVGAILAVIGGAAASAVAGLTAGQWSSIAAATSPLPGGLEGANAGDQQASLAALLSGHAELLFPGACVRAGLAALSPPPDSTLGKAVSWLAGNTTFDLQTGRIAVGASTDPEVVAARAVQRVFRIAPSVGGTAAISAMVDGGITSSHQVQAMGRARFVADYGAALGEDAALEVFQKARSLTSMARMFYVQASPALAGTDLSFLPNDGTDASVLPNYSDLFGTTGGCACPECRSIHGPAAYLVDLMQWLAARDAATTLRTRRPDIEDIELTCENTSRAMPYIDLVLEVLEDVTATGAAAAHATTAETPELLAAPEATNTAAYTALLAATSTLRTPFHRPLAETRAFLAHLGVDRVELMRRATGLDYSAFTVTAPSTSGIGVEALGLSVPMWDALTDATTTTAEEAVYWPGGLTDLEMVTELRRRTELTYPDILDLLNARFVHGASGCLPPGILEIAYTDESDLETYSIQVAAGPSALTYAEWARFRAFLRLLRGCGWTTLDLDKVLHALGMDAVADLDAAKLGAVATLAKRTGRPVVEVASWAAGVPMDTFEDRTGKEHPLPSLYDAVYLNPSLVSAADREGGDFALDASTRAELAAPTTLISAYLPQIQAALGIATEELAAVITATVGGSATMTLANLSTLHRYASFARALAIRPSELVSLLAMSGRTPFSVWEDALALVDDLAAWRASGWTLDEVAYVVNHDTERAGPTDTFIQRVLGRIREAASTYYGALGESSTEEGVRGAVAKVLAEELGVDRAVVDEWRAMTFTNAPALAVDGVDGGTFALATDMTLTTVPATAGTVARVHVQNLTVPAGEPFEFHNGAAWFEATASGDLLFRPADGDEVQVMLVDATDIALAAGTTWIYRQNTGIDAFRVTSSPAAALAEATTTARISLATDESTTPSALSATYDPGTGSTSITLPAGTRVRIPLDTRVEIARGTPARPHYEDPVYLGVEFNSSAFTDLCSRTDPLFRFLRSEFVDSGDGGSEPWSDLTRVNFGDDFELIDILAKAASVIMKLGADADERAAWDATATTWILPAPESFGADAGDTTYSGLLALVTQFAQRDRLPGTSPTFASLWQDTLGAATPTAAALASALAERTGWDATLIEAVADTLAPYGTASTSIRSGAGLRTFLDLVDQGRRSGTSAATLLSWAIDPDGDLDADISASVVTAARSRYPDAAAWSAVARPIRDLARKTQRDALVTHLLATTGLRDAEALYQSLLIDVSMNPEMLTSRIKQACCSIQLYIFRLMLGLETVSGLTLTDDDRQQWEWMRTFRVWQAARKVFLYPENWIEPELRDEKTPFFNALEQELGQGDITTERVEEATLNYLESLHAVASLKVLGYYWEREPVDGETIDRLHVVARSASSPATYWYRRREDSATWTAWEKIECGLDSDILVVQVWNRRLMLFWVTVTTGASGTDTDNEVHAIYSLYWSTCRDGKWSAKQHAEEPQLGSGHNSSSTLPVNWNYVLVADTKTAAPSLAMWIGRRIPSCDPPNVIYGGWVLDPCRGEAVARDDYAEDDYLADFEGGATHTSWHLPGFDTGHREVIDGEEGYGQLIMRRGDIELGADGEGAVSDEVPVLSNIEEAIVVTTRQYIDFVSQAPFFVHWGDRCYFVEYREPALDGAAGDVGSLREGTWPVASGEEQDDPDDVDMAGTMSLMRRSTYASDAAMRSDVSATFDDVQAQDDAAALVAASGGYTFSLFYHPYVCEFTKAARRAGIFALLDPDPGTTQGAQLFRQAIGEEDFDATFDPQPAVVAYDEKMVDFSFTGAYSAYNWELFFHLPMYVALRLNAAQRFDDAMRWFHTVFDPRTTTASTVAGGTWWKVKPFLEPVSTPVTNWVAFTASAGDGTDATSFEKQVAAWQADPFNPHLLARMRPGTYQKTVVLRYIENLLDWGDRLFTQDTIEANNEATQLYVYAKQILGDRPEIIEPAARPTPKTYADLEADLDAFGNAIVQIENDYTPVVQGLGSGSGGAGPTDGAGLTTYFCVPPNEKLFGLWDLVDDRLFKLRNGLNIAGIRRSLPLFEPPIDPAMLVRASAAGVDIGTAVDGLTLEVPHHRFSVMLNKALTVAATARALGQSLLSALEKQDAEGMALLRAGHELTLLKATTTVREQQLAEAEASLEAAQRQKVTTKARLKHYEKLVEKKWTPLEVGAATAAGVAAVLEAVQAGIQTTSSIVAVFPNITAGSAIVAATTGGEPISDGVEKAGKALGVVAASVRGAAAFLATAAQYQRREQEWKFQVAQAELEIEQIDRQIAAARHRKKAATQELANHALQIEQSAQTQEWMTSKFTNEQLYRWMSGQLGASYYQAYQMALAHAKKAEACYNHELGRSETFVQPIYWDSNRRGLLAAELLAADLDRMDASYLENDRRELELTKAISLLRLDPVALLCLQQDGETYVEIPEALFDLDCPGHYFRRLVSVSVTVACVGGTTSPINLELMLTNAGIRKQPTTAASGLDETTGLTESIVSSTAQDDSGLFQFDLRDPRYLPFERQGAISRWRLRLTAAVPSFDWTTIADVILRLRYTALDGGDAFRETVVHNLYDQLSAIPGGFGTGSSGTESGVIATVVGTRDTPDELFEGTSAELSGTYPFAMTVDVSLDQLPYLARAGTVTLTKITVLAQGAEVGDAVRVTLDGTVLTLGDPDLEAHGVCGLPSATTSTVLTTDVDATAIPLKVELGTTAADVEDIAILLHYTLSA